MGIFFPVSALYRSAFPLPAGQATLHPMHVLLTGGAGFLGSALRELLAMRSDIRVTLLRSGYGSLLSGSSESSVEAPPSLTRDELAHRIGFRDITHIVHLGALSSPELCEREPDRAHRSNVVFTEMLAQYAARSGVHLTTVSTDLVFDGVKAPPDGLTEAHQPQPRSVYARTKQLSETVTLETPRHAVVRVALLYGHTSSHSLGVLGWMEKTLKQEAPLPLFSDEYRTPIHVRDAAQAILEIAESALSGIWHCGGPTRVSRVEFGTLVAKALGYNASLIRPTSRLTNNHGPARPEDVSLNSERLWKTLGRKPREVLEALR